MTDEYGVCSSYALRNPSQKTIPPHLIGDSDLLQLMAAYSESADDDGQMVIEDVVKVISVLSADESKSADGGHR